MNEVWQQVWIAVQPVLISALIAVVAMLIRAIQRWVEGKIATDRYRKQIGIVADAILAVAQKLGLQWSDGNWTKRGSIANSYKRERAHPLHAEASRPENLSWIDRANRAWTCRCQRSARRVERGSLADR